MSDLKPCPFCGGKNIVSEGYNIFSVRCRSCGASTAPRELAVYAEGNWNARPSLDPPASDVAGWRLVPVEPTPEMLEPFARVLCSSLEIDPDEPERPHGEWPVWYGQCGPLAAAFAAMIAAAPPHPACKEPV